MAIEAQQQIKLKLAGLGYHCLLSPPDPEANRPSGGVAIVAKRELALQECEPITGEFSLARDQGRAILGLLSSHTRVPILVASVYGWPNATGDSQATAKSEALMAAVFREIEARAALPAIILTDANAPVELFASVAARLHQGAWYDLASMPNVEGHIVMEPTACAHNAKTPTRIDAIMCNARAYDRCHGHTVGEWDVVDVHRPVTCYVRTHATNPKLRAHTPLALDPVVETGLQ